MTYSLAIIFGLAPSIIWLLFFLRKDTHPESNRMILKIFFYGMLITVVAALAETGIAGGLAKWIGIYPFFSSILYIFLGIALVEEFLKYLVVREKVLNNPEFDEPVDAMLYMIIAALGFAALENILILLPGEESFVFVETLFVSLLRFLGATFLHALCSGVVGYFLALSFFKPKKRLRLIVSGLAIATFLHGFYNYCIINAVNNSYYIAFVIIMLIGLAFFVSFAFRKLKNIASVCKIT